MADVILDRVREALRRLAGYEKDRDPVLPTASMSASLLRDAAVRILDLLDAFESSHVVLTKEEAKRALIPRVDLDHIQWRLEERRDQIVPYVHLTAEARDLWVGWTRTMLALLDGKLQG